MDTPYFQTSSDCNTKMVIVVEASAMGTAPYSNLAVFDDKFLPVEWFRKNKELFENVDIVYFTRFYGDPSANIDFLDIIKYLKTVNPHISFEVFSSIEYRSKAWWDGIIAELMDNSSQLTVVRSALAGLDIKNDRKEIYDMVLKSNKVKTVDFVSYTDNRFKGVKYIDPTGFIWPEYLLSSIYYRYDVTNLSRQEFLDKYLTNIESLK